MVVVAGWTHVGETRLQQLSASEAQRALAGDDTLGMLKVMVPPMFALSQILLLAMVFTMAQRIGQTVAMTFFGACLLTVGFSAIAASQHKRLLSLARSAGAWVRR